MRPTPSCPVSLTRWAHRNVNAAAGPSKTAAPKASKRRVDYPSIQDALASPPFKGLTRNQTKEKLPGNVLSVQGGRVAWYAAWWR